MKLLALIIALVLGSYLAHGQPLDSIPFDKIKTAKGKYLLGKSEIRLNSKEPVPFKKEDFESKGRVGASVWTLLTGLSTSSSIESAWILNNFIELDQKRYDVPIMVNGVMHRERERVRDEDGYQTLETSQDIDLYWEQAALGWIIQNMDTLGSFKLEVRTSSEDPEKLWQTFTDHNIDWLIAKLDRYGMYANPYDFLVRGNINDLEFLLVYNGRYFRQALIIDGKLVGLWQDKPHIVLLSKHRVYPYTLLSKRTEFDNNQSLLLLSLGQTLARSLMGI